MLMTVLLMFIRCWRIELKSSWARRKTARFSFHDYEPHCEKSYVITKRSVDSFRMFQSKVCLWLQNLVTIQPLNKSKPVVGSSGADLDTCNWTAKETDFDKAQVLWDYKQTFGLAPNTSIEEGRTSSSPGTDLLRSPLMVEETVACVKPSAPSKI